MRRANRDTVRVRPWCLVFRGAALEWAEQGLRVMCIACKDYPSGFDARGCDLDVAAAEEVGTHG